LKWQGAPQCSRSARRCASGSDGTRRPRREQRLHLGCGSPGRSACPPLTTCERKTTSRTRTACPLGSGLHAELPRANPNTGTGHATIERPRTGPTRDHGHSFASDPRGERIPLDAVAADRASSGVGVCAPPTRSGATTTELRRCASWPNGPTPPRSPRAEPRGLAAREVAASATIVTSPDRRSSPRVSVGLTGTLGGRPACGRRLLVERLSGQVNWSSSIRSRSPRHAARASSAVSSHARGARADPSATCPPETGGGIAAFGRRSAGPRSARPPRATERLPARGSLPASHPPA